MAKRKKKKGMGGVIAGLGAILMALLLMPTTIMLLFGMLPTIVAGVADRSRRGTRTLTIGSMNLAGCTPFLIELWTKGHTADVSLTIISDPRTVILIWSIAAVGYLIDWSMSGIVSTLLVQRAAARLESIKKRQGELIERWGREVTGEMPLDAFGFPIEKMEEIPPKAEEKKT